MATWQFVAIFCALYVGTCITNKYVLSVLRFTFPTIFQGWQTAFGLVVVLICSGCNFLQINSKSKREILKWCHGVFFFIISIFSGSKALSILPIPAFIALQNTVDVLVYVFQTTQTKRLGNAAVVISAIMVLVAAYSLANSDEQNLSSGYSWMMTHIVSTVLLTLSQKWLKPASFSDVDCLLYQYLISVVILTPGSFLLGDLTDAFYFTNWYSMKFYVGCILSGLLGVLLNLTVIHMKGTDADVMPVAMALSKSILIVLSQHLFETSLTSDFRFCLLVNMTAYYVFLWLHPLVEGAGGAEETVQKLSKEVV